MVEGGEGAGGLEGEAGGGAGGKARSTNTHECTTYEPLNQRAHIPIQIYIV